jgi:hypothetical protein
LSDSCGSAEPLPIGRVALREQEQFAYTQGEDLWERRARMALAPATETKTGLVCSMGRSGSLAGWPTVW